LILLELQLLLLLGYYLIWRIFHGRGSRRCSEDRSPFPFLLGDFDRRSGGGVPSGLFLGVDLVSFLNQHAWAATQNGTAVGE
jgi:hypothetical protein